jgi:pimeloyl-ACP methyl ester carboxylesterase
MPQRHHLPVSVTPARDMKSLAHWSLSPATHLVIFVHGFGGGAINTWPDFPLLLAENPSLPSFDYFFYGYDARTQQASNSGLELSEWLRMFLKEPAAYINKSIPKTYERAPFSYERIVIVAHSLGAVVVRIALLDADRRAQSGKIQADWLQRLRLVLLAPAHNGAHAAKIAYALLSDFGWAPGKLLGNLVLWKMPLLTELQSNSDLMKDLRRDSASVIKRSKAAKAPVPPFVRAHTVLWAKDEHIVRNARFLEDEDPEQVDTDHKGICKPTDLKHRALQAVWEAL